MPCKVIPFPAAGSARSAAESILARHHIVLEVGRSRYEVDVLGFVKPLAAGQAPAGSGTDARRTTSPVSEGRPATVVQVVQWSRSLRHGWLVTLRLEGRRQQWEEHWRELGISMPAADTRDHKVKNSLAIGRRQSDESSCAESAQKEENMTNAESRDTTPDVGATGGTAATKPARSPRRPTPAKGASKKHKGPTARRTASRKAHRQTGRKVAKTAAVGRDKKPRAHSKGAAILELIGRAKGATLSEIMQATSWQAHSVRGFLSTAAKKHGLQIESTKSESGDRVYRIQK